MSSRMSSSLQRSKAYDNYQPKDEGGPFVPGHFQFRGLALRDLIEGDWYEEDYEGQAGTHLLRIGNGEVLFGGVGDVDYHPRGCDFRGPHDRWYTIYIRVIDQGGRTA